MFFAPFSLCIRFQTQKSTSERGTVDKVIVEFIIQTGTTWRVKRAINNLTGTTATSWAVLGKTGCVVKKTLGSRTD